MDSLVPSFISIGGVDFPLEANPLSVGLASSTEELEVLRFAVDEMVKQDRNVTRLTARRGGHS